MSMVTFSLQKIVQKLGKHKKIFKHDIQDNKNTLTILCLLSLSLALFSLSRLLYASCDKKSTLILDTLLAYNVHKVLHVHETNKLKSSFG